MLRDRAVEAGPFALSSAQQQVWRLTSNADEDAAYHFTIAFRLRGRLDAGALKRSIRDVAARHETLRTTFHGGTAGPFQLVHRSLPVELPTADVTGARDKDEELRRIVRAETGRPFDLAREPSARIRVVAVGPDDHALLVSVHRILGEGWSVSLLFWELAQLYEAYSTGRASPLPELRIQYRDFVEWERAQVDEATLEAQLAYWRNRLADAPDPPFDTHRRGAPAGTSAGGRAPIPLASDLVDGLRQLARSEGTTLYVALLAVLAAALYRSTAREDVVIGSPTFVNREWRETEALVGLFGNALAYRIDLSGNPTFRELLARTRSTVLDGYANRHAPLLDVLRALGHEPDPLRQRLVQVVFALSDTPFPSLSLGGIDIELLDVDAGSAKFDLTLSIAEWSGQFLGILEYREEIFDSRAAAAFLALYEAVAASAVLDPDTRIDALQEAPPVAAAPRARTAGTRGGGS